jgi:hypothetical protein
MQEMCRQIAILFGKTIFLSSTHLRFSLSSYFAFDDDEKKNVQD